jgi:hypothetical protein
MENGLTTNAPPDCAPLADVLRGSAMSLPMFNADFRRASSTDAGHLLDAANIGDPPRVTLRIGWKARAG